MTRILLLGANGQVGHELKRSLARLGTIIPTTRTGVLPGGMPCEAVDFDRPASLPGLLGRLRPGLVVNAAAYTAVDRAEDDVDAAWRANAEAPAMLASYCAKHGVPLVHYSTDYVFDGTRERAYREEDPTAPLGVYGASKRAGEEAILRSGAPHLIFRTAWVYGERGSNFLLTMLRLAREHDELRVVSDQRGTPTPAGMIADVTSEVIANHPQERGLIHLTAAGETSWHGFAEAIMAGAHRRGLIPRLPRVLPIPSSAYPTRASRPAYSRLDTGKLEALLGRPMPAWETGLEAVLDHISPDLPLDSL
ncbi:dTDP-4-dehydrorhamnose reductase [Pseudoxanthomonas sp. 22568]|uniref:dTDP-4-dehydrorhamnose reductase n=1 Tax=Pseudoxanthomonas sp. 22568 TaxID=3453945 RepID=UPI003F86F12D